MNVVGSLAVDSGIDDGATSLVASSGGSSGGELLALALISDSEMVGVASLTTSSSVTFGPGSTEERGKFLVVDIVDCSSEMAGAVILCSEEGDNSVNASSVVDAAAAEV